MIPQSLPEWTLSVIENLLQKGYFEPELFDYKEKLPDPKNTLDKDRLRKTSCAFANSNGGFLVFGIDDNRTKNYKDRIIGLPPNIDFPEQFGNYPSKCIPAIDWDFLNPPIHLANGNLIHIAYIPQSWQAPHCISEENKFIFPKRTNDGNSFMDYGEIRQLFLNKYEKLLKLQLLKIELENIISLCERLIMPVEKSHTSFYPGTLDIQVLQSILSDTYTLLYKETDLIRLLISLKNKCTTQNNKCAMFYTAMSLPMGNTETLLEGHNNYLKQTTSEIIMLTNDALKLLTRFATK